MKVCIGLKNRRRVNAFGSSRMWGKSTTFRDSEQALMGGSVQGVVWLSLSRPANQHISGFVGHGRRLCMITSLYPPDSIIYRIGIRVDVTLPLTSY